MNLKEIRDDVRSLIIEPVPGFRSDVELNRWINQAHQELGMTYRLEKTAQIQLTPGVVFYPLPEDFLFLLGAWTDTGESVPIVPITSGSRVKVVPQSDSPVTVFTFGNNIAVSPPPSEDSEVSGLTIFYERRPAMLVRDTDVPEIPEPYHRFLVSFAAMRSFQKDEDYEAEQVYANEYDVGKALVSVHKIPVSMDLNYVLAWIRAGVLNAAEAAEWLNRPMNNKIWQRVELEEKGLLSLSAGAISKSDLMKNSVFTAREAIQERLQHTASDILTIPGWEQDDHAE